ncbi:hypothetical protein H6G97_16305 [Nostoc flagelliforme FACHB-838]|uniref:Uncharacterized protein n=1 Tax=Nostoc flagelliforme FACHB-838 TaxID=2692904 RepID=A0ABR8DRT8_9NOSO|nr:hypothetical protein [Nostoc flagelliforme]MBD2531058.1 hypothetical protein [Nostoc flagelliforme FACHB-838]
MLLTLPVVDESEIRVYNSPLLIPIHENPDTYRFIVRAWQRQAFTSVFVSLLKLNSIFYCKRVAIAVELTLLLFGADYKLALAQFAVGIAKVTVY